MQSRNFPYWRATIPRNTEGPQAEALTPSPVPDPTRFLAQHTSSSATTHLMRETSLTALRSHRCGAISLEVPLAGQSSRTRLSSSPTTSAYVDCRVFQVWLLCHRRRQDLDSSRPGLCRCTLTFSRSSNYIHCRM